MTDIDESTHTAPLLKVDRAYKELKELIVTMKLEPGSHIDERAMMMTFGIGRTPLREAMLRLVPERLVMHSPRRGMWVSPLSLSDLRHMIEARLFLEPHVAGLAAERITEKDVATLHAMLDEAQTAISEQNSEAVVAVDFRLHSFIARCARNDYLAASVDGVNSAMLRYWHLSSRNEHTLPSWQGNHDELVSAITCGNSELAEKQSRLHVLGLRDLLRDLVV